MTQTNDITLDGSGEELPTEGAGTPVIPGMGEEGEQLATELTEGTDASVPGSAETGAVESHVDPSAKVAATDGRAAFGTSRADRVSSRELADFPVLTGREEDWRFTPLQRLAGLHLPDGDESRLSGTAPSVQVQAQDGVTVETVAREDSRLGSVLTPDDRVSAAAWNSFTEATVVTVPAELELSEPIRITVEGSSDSAAAQHLLVVAEPHSRADIVITHRGTAVVAQNVEFDVRDGAGLSVTSIQAWEDQAVHASAQQAAVAKDATFKHVAVSYGGSLVRLTPTARFTGPGAETELYGLYFADAGQHLEQRLFVDHAVPNCTSNVLYKGALQGRDAHTVWVGDVLIRKEAEGTDTYEKNQNLVLSDGARADSVPNLEIETGVIEGAGHASATGRFDEEQLYYLMARGIPETEARKLVVRGFLNEIIQKIGVEDVEQELTEIMEDELQVAKL